MVGIVVSISKLNYGRFQNPSDLSILLFIYLCNMHDCCLISTPDFGKSGATKLDEFSEKFQTAFDPLPSFLENYIAIFFIMD